MKIDDANVIQVQKDIRLKVTFNKKQFELLFRTIDGKIKGDFSNGVMTSYLDYFNYTSKTVRKKHFKFFKEFIEKNF
jgi:hypothetical protein